MKKHVTFFVLVSAVMCMSGCNTVHQTGSVISRPSLVEISEDSSLEPVDLEESMQTALVTAPSLTDPRDGKVYKCVSINGRVWMAQNLNYTVPGIISGQGYYANNPANGNIYGRLYAAGIIKPETCPMGWGLPTDAELTAMENAVASLNALKSTTWPAGTNTSGFALLPGGYCNQTANSVGLGSSTGLWTATNTNGSWLNGQVCHRYTSKIVTMNHYQDDYYYVRLIKLLPTVNVVEKLDTLTGLGTFQGSSIVTINISKTIKQAGTGSVKMVFSNTDYCGFGVDYMAAKKNWYQFTYITFYMYGANTGNSVRMEIADNSGERFVNTLPDNFVGWKKFKLNFSSFTRRTDWQPVGAPDDGFTKTAIEGLSFAPVNLGAGTWYFDQITIGR